MNRSQVAEAMKEAERFIVKAKVVLRSKDNNDGEFWQPSKETGAVRRASMDLTRALATMRGRT